MTIEHFLFGLDEEGNYFFLKTKGVNTVLTDHNLQILRTNKESSEEPLWLETEQLIAIQDIDEINNGGRIGMWNHTMLIPVQEYIRANNPYKLYSKYFLKKGEVPAALKPIEIEESP